jgi:uncharacterized membrane protein
MKKNVGNSDRIIRSLIAVTIIILYFTSIITGTIGIVLLALAAVFVITAFVGICPLYLILRWSTHVGKQKVSQ